jgi:hypothetical protein
MLSLPGLPGEPCYAKHPELAMAMPLDEHEPPCRRMSFDPGIFSLRLAVRWSFNAQG